MDEFVDCMWNTDGSFFALSGPLGALAETLPKADARELANAIVGLIEVSHERESVRPLNIALSRLIAGLDSNDIRKLAPRLLHLLRANPDTLAFALYQPLIEAAHRLDSSEIRPIAFLSVESLLAGKARIPFVSLIEGVAQYLSDEDVTPLLQLMKSGMLESDDPAIQCSLAAAMAPFSAELDQTSFSLVINTLLEQMSSAESFEINDPADALIAMSAYLEADDRMKVARDTIELITKNEQYSLQKLLEALACDIQQAQARELAAKIVEKMYADRGFTSSLDNLGSAFVSIAPLIPSKEIRPAVWKLAKVISEERGEYSLMRIATLSLPLNDLAGKLNSSESAPIVEMIVQRMQNVKDESVLALLGATVGSFSALDGTHETFRIAAKLVVERIKIEQRDEPLVSLVNALELLAQSAVPADANWIVESIVTRMRNERDGNHVAVLGRAISFFLDWLTVPRLIPRSSGFSKSQTPKRIW